MAQLRIGVLGAARIAPAAIIKPAREDTEAEVVAVAARDAARARSFADKHGIPRAYGGYPELLADPEVDAIYNPLPNGLHGRWTIAALEAGKHVLCEKPFTANAEEARSVTNVANATGLVVMEAFHYRYHPLARRMVEIVNSGELGELRHVEASMCFPLPRFSDIRYSYALAGGALMDAGCYPTHLVRTLGGSAPEVVSAQAKLRDIDIDRAMTAQLRFAEGHTGAITCSMWSSKLLVMSARVQGTHGELRALNPYAPQAPHRLKVRTTEGRRVERFTHRTSYAFQLDAFCDAVLRGKPVLTPPMDAIANMSVIDSIYQAANLHPRRPAEPEPKTPTDG